MNAIVKAPVSQALRPQTFGELMQFADRAARSSMVPPAFKGKPDDIVLAIQMGSEVGLAPMQALQNIAVIGGRPAIWGDAMPGLCRQSAVCDDIEEWFEGEGDSLTAFCKATRTGKKPVLQQFSVTDAKKAGLWNKTGPWTQYPRRMLQMRARGFALRDAFPDVLRGLIAVEEAQDIPPGERFTGTTLEHTPAPPAPEPSPRGQPRETADAIGDELPPDIDTEGYPFAHRAGGQMYPNADEWLGRWQRLARDCRVANAMGKLASARALNASQIAAVREFDPAAALAVEELLDAALAPDANPADALIARIEAMDFAALRVLDSNATYRAELNALPADAARAVVEAVSGRLANLRAEA